MTDANTNSISTRWTLIWRAAAEDSSSGRPALEQLIQRYWKPLYGFARLRGLSIEDAEDATQGFLSNLLDRHWLSQVDPAKGRFRSYLLTAWKHYLIDQYRKENRQRRGGSMKRVPLDMAEAESSFQTIASRTSDPEHSFMLAWANNILESTRARLASDYASRGCQKQYESLSLYLTSPIDNDKYQELSTQLNISASSLRVALHRLRQRFGEMLREVVQETLEDPSDVDQELRELMQVLLARPD